MFRWLVEHELKPTPDARVLDLGCGNGGLLETLSRHGLVHTVGVDASAQQVEVARQSGLDNVIHADIGDYLRSTDDEFDLIFAIDILEHLEPETLLALLPLMRERLSSGGMLVAQVPNGGGVFGGRVFFGDLTHQTAFTARSAAQALAVSGFHDVRVEEIHPIVHGLPSFVRYVVWHLLILPFRVLQFAERGRRPEPLSQNILVFARR